MVKRAKPAPFPTDPEQLRKVAVSAEVFLRIDAAVKYGLIEGGLDIDVDRCDEAIAFARKQGVRYGPDDVDRALMAIVAELSR